MPRLLHQRRAFTLIEIIVAMAMFAVLAGTLFTLLGSAIKLRETSDHNLNRGLQRDLATQMMRRDLRNMVVPNGILAAEMIGELNSTELDGTTQLSFVTTVGEVSDLEPWIDMRRITYRLEAPSNGDTSQGYDLVREVEDNLLPVREIEEIIAPPQWRLLSHVAAMTIEYYDDEDEVWLESWDSTVEEDSLPTLITIRVDFMQPSEMKGDVEDMSPQPPLLLAVDPAVESRSTGEESSAGEDSGGDNNGPQGGGQG